MSAAHPLRADGIWFERLRPIGDAERILFLDRDGVIIHDRGYLADPAGVELVEGIVAIIAAAEAAGIPAVIVTNQSGIGRGYFGWDAFAAVQARMLALLAAAGARPCAVLACPHHAEARDPYRHPDHPMRKPNPGMLLAAASLYGIDPAASLMIGDKADDMSAAARAGLNRGILVQDRSGGLGAATGLSLGLTVTAVRRLREAEALAEDWAMGKSSSRSSNLEFDSGAR